MIRPPLFFVMFSLICFIYVNLVFYQLWFRSQKMVRRYRDSIYRLPSWKPLRNLALVMSKNEKWWIGFSKVLAGIAEVFISVWFVLMLIAWIVGK